MKKMKLREGVMFNKIEDEGMLIDQNSGEFFALNEVGCFILDKLLENQEVSEVVKEIIGEFAGVEEADAQEDVEAFIADIKEFGFV